MAVDWGIRLVFTDNKGLKTSKTFRTQTPGADMAVEFTGILNDLDSLIAAFRAVTDAGVSAVISVYDSDYAGDAAQPDSRVSNYAHVNLYLSPPPDEKLYGLQIPAPIDALFVGGDAGTDVDITNAALVALVAELANNYTVSDEEAIDLTTTNGIKDGEWRSKHLNPR